MQTSSIMQGQEQARPSLCKLEHLVNHEWVRHSFAHIFEYRNECIFGGIPNSDSALFAKLVSCLNEPISLLYVLLKPRSEAIAGHYQSEKLSMRDFLSFMDKYADFLSGDSRFNLWANSARDNSTIVWNRHNEFFAYGQRKKFISVLNSLGFKEGELPKLGAHKHLYRHELDYLAQEIISEYKWTYSPLSQESME